jgi:hypothetical protein
VNGPSDHGSRRQTCPRPQPRQSTTGVTGGTASIFHAGTASHSDTTTCPNLQVGSGAGVADGPSGAVTRGLDWSGRAGAARRRRRTGSSFGVRGAILGRVRRDVAAALPGLGSATSIRSRRMWRHGLGVWVGRPGPRRVMPNHSANQPGHVGRKEPAGRWASGPSVTSTKIR